MWRFPATMTMRPLLPYLEWNKRYDTGIEAIDAQHRQLVRYANDLVDARESGSRAVISRVLDNLVDYTRTHFAFEEKLIEEAGYPYTEGHCRVHKRFVARIEDLRSTFLRGGDVSEDLEQLLSKWLLVHISSDDASYAARVRDRMNALTQIDAGASSGGVISRMLATVFKGP